MSDEERIAYVVTSGEYSDYGISAVFDNEAAAKEYAGTWENVEQFTLNSTQPVERTYWFARVITVPTAHAKSSTTMKTTTDWVQTRSQNCAWIWEVSGQPNAQAAADTPEQAEKIAHDLIAQLRYEFATNGKRTIP